jgi:hypothetical protein
MSSASIMEAWIYVSLGAAWLQLPDSFKDEADRVWGVTASW